MIDAVRFLSWLSTATLVGDVGEDLNESTLVGYAGLIFDDRSYITINMSDFEVPQFHTVCGREEFADDELMSVCQFLWDNHARDNWHEGAR